MQKCFLVCNAHLDPVWLWPWEEGLTEAISTFRVAADFCEEYPDFVFVHNEALLYEWVERNDPELFARIRKLVAAGKWCVSGGAYLQPDLVGPGGEALIRQYLIGLGYFRSRFGVRPLTAYNFDTFGHPQGLIQILAGCGFRNYVFCRPSAAQKTLPVGSFRWRHRSGAEIVGRRSDDHYITQGELRRSMRDGNWPERYREEGDFMFLWGLGNHGGGPSREEYAQLPGMRADFPEVEFIESSPDAFFAHSLARRGYDALPVVSGDLHGVNEGCYVSMLRIKQRHWELENLAGAVERWCTLAWRRGLKPYPAADLNSAWKDILFSEFHDSLPGSGIPTVEREILNALGHAEEILRRKRAETWIALLRDEPPGENLVTPFFVFNPHAHEVDALVEMEYGTARQWGTDGILRRLCCDGRELPAQFEKGELNLDEPNWGEWRQKAVFRLTIPALSYRRIDAHYEVVPKPEIRRWTLPPMPEPGRIVVRGEGFEFTVSRRTGLASCRVGDRELLKPGSWAPLVYNDIPNSWNLAPVREPAADQFRLMTTAEATAYLTTGAVNPGFRRKCRPVQLIEDGPFRSVIEAHFISGRSTLTLRYLVEKTRPRVRVEVLTEFLEADKLLKLVLRPAGGLRRLEAEKCYSIDDETAALTPPDRERTFQKFLRWTPEQGSPWGVVGHGTHGYHLQGSTLQLSVLRTPAYGCMSISPENERYLCRRIPHQDRGLRETAFTLAFGPAAASPEALTRAALEIGMPPVGFVYFPTRRGATAQTPAPELEIAAPNVVLGALKKAESGEDTVLRFWECGGCDSTTSFRWQGREYPLTIGAWQLATVRIAPDGAWCRTNLLEEQS